MKYFGAILFALFPMTIVPVVHGDDCVSETEETKLQFFDSELIQNDLHKPGGAMIYANVGLFENDQIDLEITSMDNMNPDWPYSNIEQVWVDRARPVPNNNGLYGSFGQINLQTVKEYPTSGQGNFKFCLKSHTTGELITLPSFSFSIYDLDKRGNGNAIEERLIVDMNTPGYKSFLVYPNMQESQAKISCEDSSESFPCETSRTIFRSSERGTQKDNPSDPDNLTQLQLKRSVSFAFEDTSCFELTYDHFCPYEQEEYTGTVASCDEYTGGNFLFAGYSEAISTESTCIPVPVSTYEPTASPSAAPSAVHTSVPTAAPTETPTDESTSSPTEGEDPAPPPTCPDDIKLIKQSGETPIDLADAIHIVEQTTDTVTVKLNNAWADSSNSVDQIFYQYNENSFNLYCFSNSTVTGGEIYNEITIQCYHAKPFAILEICVSDDEALESGDDATVPQCCDKENSNPAVCYTMSIKCETECVQAQGRARGLRGNANTHSSVTTFQEATKPTPK